MFFNNKRINIIEKELSSIANSFETFISLEKVKIQSKKNIDNIDSNIEIMIDRFYKLFELHDILPIEIPQVLNDYFNISIFDISSKENLLKVINIDILKWISDFFGTRLDWLLNRSDILYDELNFDKCEMNFFRLINSLSKENNLTIDIIRTCELKKNDSNEQKQLIYPFVRVSLIKLNERIIYKNIPINTYIWDYRRSRLDFKTIIYMLYHGHISYYGQKIYMNGYNKNKQLSRYDFMQGLIKYDELKGDLKSQTWYPSDYIEEKNSGISLENDEFQLVLDQIKKEKLINLSKEYLDFWNKKEEKNDYNLENFNMSICEKQNPIIIYTEGKTDIMHIENAWKILFEKEHNFQFISFDGIIKLSNHISSTNKTIENQITDNKIIAIFDSDETGIKEFKKLTGVDPKEQFALSKNSNQIFILLLPVSEIDLNNLCEIEFLYPRSILEKYNMLTKREFTDIVKLCQNNRRLAYEIDDMLNENKKVDSLKYYKIIESRKKEFAQELLTNNNLKKEDLKEFRNLFNVINKILEYSLFSKDNDTIKG